jgi:hypothetical protein
MPEFLFQIKGKRGEPTAGFYGGDSNWSFPPIWQDKVEANNAKEAKLVIEDLYGRKFPLRVLSKDLESTEFLLNIKEIKDDDIYTKKLFENTDCTHCKSQFKIIEKYQMGANNYGGRDFCSSECANKEREKNRIPTIDFKESVAIHDYVIYKITNRETNMCYIGQTKQAFTFRWYQHFYQTKDVKFHEAIMSFPVTAWIFEVIEVIDIPEEIKYDKAAIRNLVLSKETEYIRKFNCVVNGYNSVKSKDDGIENYDQVNIEFENE